MDVEVKEQLESDHETLDERIGRLSIDPRSNHAELSLLKKLRLHVRDKLEGIIPASVIAT
jgi:uncharacterized protein YdcH (DUF465 family)